MPRTIYFNPDASGLEVFLGPMETRLMELAWKHGELTVKKALFHIGNDATEDDSVRLGTQGKATPRGGSQKGDSASTSRPAYTTVMTVLSRLAEKGILVRQKRGRNFVYCPAMSRDEFMAERTRLVMRAMENSLRYKICF